MAHGTGYIQKKYQIGGWCLTIINILCLQSDHQKLCLLIPRTYAKLSRHAEGLLPLGLFVIIGKVIEKLFNSYCSPRKLLQAVAFRQQSAKITVGSGVHIC